MKKAIKKTCVVLLLFALLVSQVAASYSETGTLNEGTSAISAAERYLSNWAYNSYMYADKNLTLGTVLDAEVEPAKLTLATSEIMALRNDADGQENNITTPVSRHLNRWVSYHPPKIKKDAQTFYKSVRPSQYAAMRQRFFFYGSGDPNV